MTTHLSAPAAVAREAARRTTGQFGTQPLSEADLDLEGAPAPVVAVAETPEERLARARRIVAEGIDEPVTRHDYTGAGDPQWEMAGFVEPGSSSTSFPHGVLAVIRGHFGRPGADPNDRAARMQLRRVLPGVDDADFDRCFEEAVAFWNDPETNQRMSVFVDTDPGMEALRSRIRSRVRANRKRVRAQSGNTDDTGIFDPADYVPAAEGRPGNRWAETRELTDVQVAARIDERLYFASLAGHLPAAATYTVETLDPVAAEAAGHTYRVRVHLAAHVHAHCTKIVDIATRVPSGYGKELASRAQEIAGAYAAPSEHRVNRSAKVVLVNAGD